MDALHTDATPGYEAGRISSNNISVFMEKITGRTKQNEEETVEEKGSNLVLHNI